MQRVGIIIVALAAIAIGRLAASQPAGQQLVMLNLVTAGDQNMVDYVKDYLGPMFEKEHPGVTVRAVGTGPGDAGSQKIYEKLEAEKNNSSWDIDVAVIHQKAAGEMVTKGLLARYVAEVPTAKLVTSDAAKRALGANVSGYHADVPVADRAAYNADMLKAARQLRRVRDGRRRTRSSSATMASRAACRVAFVAGWVYAFGGGAGKLTQGPYGQPRRLWDTAFGEGLQQNVVITPGNAGARHAQPRRDRNRPGLGRHVYTWQADGKLPPT